MALLKLFCESSQSVVLFRNFETQIEFGVYNERDDVLLIGIENDNYNFDRPVSIPWANNQQEFDRGHHILLQVNHLNWYIWEQGGHIRASTRGWQNQGFKIPGHSDSSGNHVISVRDNNSIYATALTEEQELPHSPSVEKSEWRIHLNYNQSHISTWYLSGMPFLFTTISNSSWHQRPMQLVAADRGTFYLGDIEDGKRWWVSTQTHHRPGKGGPNLILTDQQSEALRLRPLIDREQNSICFQQARSQGTGYLTIDTRGHRIIIADYNPERNTIPHIQHFSYKLHRHQTSYFWINHSREDRVIVASAAAPGALVQMASNAVVDEQLWYFEEDSQRILNKRWGVALDVNPQNELCTMPIESGKESQHWKMEEPYLIGLKNDQVVTLKNKPERLKVQAKLEPISPSQFWHLAPYIPA